MIRLHWLGLGALALAAIAACATSSDGAAALPAPTDESPSGLPDAQAPNDAFEGGTDALPPQKSLERCSPDGWCITDLPDDDLDLRDVRPFQDRAFAVAESQTLGIQFLEWERSTDAWKFINEGTQNQLDRGNYAGNMWAPNENEVYFTLAPAFVYHGKRPDPGSPFTWKISRLDTPDGASIADDAGAPADDGGLPDAAAGRPAHDPGRVWGLDKALHPPVSADAFAPSLGVQGMPWGDVYAWYGPTLFRRTVAESGDDVWVVEHRLLDDEYPDDEFHIQSITGGAPDDFWIGGVRSLVGADGMRERACPLVVQRRADGYHHLVDHVVDAVTASFTTGCNPKPGSQRLVARWDIPDLFALDFEEEATGWLQSLQHIAPNTVVGIKVGNGGQGLVYVKSDGDTPLARLNIVDYSGPIWSLNFSSVWVADGSAWMSGHGFVLSLEYNPTDWSRGVGISSVSSPAQTLCSVMQCATFTPSSIARGGVVHEERLHQLRGISSTNLWAVGNRHALHKTTP